MKEIYLWCGLAFDPDQHIALKLLEFTIPYRVITEASMDLSKPNDPDWNKSASWCEC
ncbi:MAG TPA: hypothetical protein VFF30_19840 [Nitrososphaerales archaeon]|nr:hypothetical protein [Nitrososphaerales archaeon]